MTERLSDTRNALSVSVFLTWRHSLLASWEVPHDLLAHVSRNCVFTWQLGVCVFGVGGELPAVAFLTISSLVNNPVGGCYAPPPQALLLRVAAMVCSSPPIL